MKNKMIRIMPLVLSLCLLLPVATLAQTDSLTHFVSGKGYSIWYDATVIEPISEDEGGGLDAFQSYPANPYAVDLAIHASQSLDFSLESAMADAKQMLHSNGYSDIIDIDTSELFPQELKSAGCRGIYDGKEYNMQYVLVAPDSTEYHISLRYPVEAEEYIGKQLRDVLQSFQASGN